MSTQSWQQVKVLVFGREAGAADALGPVVLALNSLAADCLVLAKGPAANGFRRQGVPYCGLTDDSEASIEGMCHERWHTLPDLVFTSATSLPSLDMTERRLWQWAKRQGVPSAALLDQWHNYALRFSGVDPSERLAFLPDRIFVMDQVALNDAVDDGIPADRLHVTGQPAFAAFWAEHDPPGVAKLRAERRIDPRSLTVVFVAESVRDEFGDQLGYDEFSVLQVVLEILEQHNATGMEPRPHLLVKLHPQNSPEKFGTILGGLRFPVTVVGAEYHPRTVLDAADLVTGMSSILLVHAILLDKPTLSLELNTKGISKMVATRIGAIPFVQDRSVACETLLSLIQDSSFRARWVQRQRDASRVLRREDAVQHVMTQLHSLLRGQPDV